MKLSREDKTVEKIKDPECRFGDSEKCFAWRDGRCSILEAMPKPRKGGSCPFYKTKKDGRKKDWDG